MIQLLKELLSGAQPQGFNAAAEDRLRVATCALLIEVAQADDAFGADEREAIETILSRRFELSRGEVHDLMEAARAAKKDRVDLFHFTRELNRQLSSDEKRSVLDEIWRVIFADGRLDAHEDHIVHRVAQLLNLTHPQLIASKLRVREEMGL